MTSYNVVRRRLTSYHVVQHCSMLYDVVQRRLTSYDVIRRLRDVVDVVRRFTTSCDVVRRRKYDVIRRRTTSNDVLRRRTTSCIGMGRIRGVKIMGTTKYREVDMRMWIQEQSYEFDLWRH